MRWKSKFRVSLLTVWCLASFNVNFVKSATTTAKTLPAESTTVVAGILDSGTWKYPKLCYVEKSTVNELITRMNQTVQILNRKDAYLKCNERIEAAIVDANDIKLCDDDRILKIQKDLSEVAAGLFQLAIRLSEPSEEDVLSLDRKKFQLVYDLKALRVFYGPSLCNENSIALYPFQPLVEYVEWNLNQVFVLFQTTRPTRLPPSTTPSTPKVNIIDEMLRHDKSFEELTKMARSNPATMSKTIAKVVAQRYHGRQTSFENLLNFVEELPTTENRILGFAAIRDEMFRYNSNPEPIKLAKLANSVQRLQEFSATTINFVDDAARSKLTDLVDDPNLNPLILLLSSQRSFQELIEMARSNPKAMSNAMPEIVAQRYNGSASQFEVLIDFTENLPTPENQIFGVAAIHNAIHRQNQTLEMSKQWLQLARSVQRLNESSSATLDSFARAKFADLVNDAELNAMLLMLNFENSLFELTEMARSNPTAMSKVLPEIILQRWIGNTSTLDDLLAFAEVLPTTENRIIGVSAIYGEMYRYNRNPESDALVKMAKSVERLNESASTTSESVDAAAISKLSDLVYDSNLSPLMHMLDSDLSLLELTELARSNPTAMSRALPEIISQRWTFNGSSLDNLLAFIEGLPMTENRIVGLTAIREELYRFESNPEPQKLMKFSKIVHRVNESASATSGLVDETAKSKFANLVNDPALNQLNLLLNRQRSYQELTEMARLNPTAMSEALPEIVTQRYNASDSSFETLLNFIEGLPSAENQVFGFAAVYSEILRYSHSQAVSQMLKMAETVKRLNETVGTSSNDTSSMQSKLADLVDNLSPLILIGEKAECRVTNVAHQLQLYTNGYESPWSAYLASYSVYRIQVYAKVKDGRLVFRISWDVIRYPFYASDTNTDSRNTKYETQPSERYVLMHWNGALPPDAELDWKLVPIKNKANQFKILSAKFDDFMFAHQSATGYASLRRVLLGRKSHSPHANISEADNWTFDCRPGNFTIAAS